LIHTPLLLPFHSLKDQMPRRIVQVVTQMEAGGAQTVALLLHRELISRGIDAELWFLYVKTPVWASEPGVHSLWQRRPAWNDMVGMLWALFRQIRRVSPDAVIAHTHYAHAIALPVARICGVRNRLAVHHNAISTYPWLAQRLEACCKRLGICSESVAVSEDVRRSLLELNSSLYLRTTRCIYNGLSGQCAGEMPIEDVGDYKGRRLLFNVGRLTEQKNQVALIEAMPTMPECVMVIAGRGPMECALKQRAEELGVGSQLRLLGEIEPSAVIAWMRRADAFVFPSKFEAMPMALLEAMRAGMAIVASDIPAHREVAGTTAFLTSTDPVSLSASIRAALKQKDGGNAMGGQARERSLRFTVSAMADGYLACL
jgi:glycosyltransferase involved in cell wall biosynthesis